MVHVFMDESINTIYARTRATLESDLASTHKPEGLEAPGPGGRNPPGPYPVLGVNSTSGRCSENSIRIRKE